MGCVLVGEVRGWWRLLGRDRSLWEDLGVGRRGLGLVGAYMAHYM